MEEVRLDELLLDARELVLKAHPDYHIELVFEQEAEEDNVLTRNRKQLSVDYCFCKSG